MSSLYLEHFRLGEAPFGITPNGKFFFEGQARGAILDALHHAVLDEDGIDVAVQGRPAARVMVCLGNVPGKAAAALDVQLDDGRPDSGTFRATQGANNAPPAAAATAYSEDQTYTVCRDIT